VKLNQIPVDEANSSLLAQSHSESGALQVRFRKGDKNEKDIFVEVWSAEAAGGLRSSLKVTDKLSKIYNDTVFGGITWSLDESKICFIGEVPEIEKFKNPFDLKKEEDKKDEENKAVEEEKKEPEEEHWQDEKFLHKEDFGEMLVGKKSPAIFVFDIKENSLS